MHLLLVYSHWCRMDRLYLNLLDVTLLTLVGFTLIKAIYLIAPVLVGILLDVVLFILSCVLLFVMISIIPACLFLHELSVRGHAFDLDSMQISRHDVMQMNNYMESSNSNISEISRIAEVD